jgi:hypothetical protein
MFHRPKATRSDSTLMQFCYGYNMSMNHLDHPEGVTSLPSLKIRS